MLPSSLRYPHIRHSHQETSTLLCVELFYALSYYDGLNNPLLLFALGDRRTDGSWYNSVAISQHYSADFVRLTPANIRSAANSSVLRAHYVEHLFITCFLVHCVNIFSPFT